MSAAIILRGMRQGRGGGGGGLASLTAVSAFTRLLYAVADRVLAVRRVTTVVKKTDPERILLRMTVAWSEVTPLLAK